MRSTLPAVAVAALCIAPAAEASDAASTHAYLQANYTMLAGARRHLRAAEAAPLKLLAALKRECPQAAHGSPQDPNSTQVSNEVIGAMVLSAYRLDVPAIHRFVAAAARLRWSSTRLTRAVRTYARQLRTLIGLAPPSLCADIHAWAATGYTALGQGTISFDQRFMPNWVPIGNQPAGLSAHEGSAERRVARLSTRLEWELADGEARAVQTWGKLVDELEVWP